LDEPHDALKEIMVKCTIENPNTDMKQLSAVQPTKTNPAGYTDNYEEEQIEYLIDENGIVITGVN
jgi:hypothetical protein